MDERHEELAALNAFGMLEGDEQRVLSGACVSDKELRALSVELEQTTAELGHLVAPMAPPADMKRRIRGKIRSRGGRLSTLSPGAVIGAVGWALAAALAVASVWLWNERVQLTKQFAALSKVIIPVTPAANGKTESRSLEDELKSLRDDFEAKKTALSTEVESLRKRETEANTRIVQLTTETEALKKRDALAQVQIATLQSSVWEYRKSVVVVVWDDEKHQGVLKLEKMPPVETGKDYQLWVVDPKKPQPVNAGVVQVDSKGFAKIDFKPVDAVSGAAKFVLSVEKKGGVPKNEGQIVLTGP